MKKWILGIGGTVMACALISGAVFLKQQTKESTIDNLICEILTDENFVDLFLCDDPLLAVHNFRGKSEALNNLLNREDAEEILLRRISEYKHTDNADEEMEKDGLEIILHYVESGGYR